MLAPPSMVYVLPVIHDDSFDAKNTAREAISAGVPNRPRGCRLMLRARAAAGSGVASKDDCNSAVSTDAGQMALTRTLVAANSRASVRVSVIRAPFEAE